MRKIVLVFLIITCKVFSQNFSEKRDTVFLVFDKQLYKTIELNKAEIKKKLHYKYKYSNTQPISWIKLVTNKNWSKVKINREKICVPSERLGISWFEEDLNNAKVIYIIEKINNREKVRKV
jgi:hypothetical protein